MLRYELLPEMACLSSSDAVSEVSTRGSSMYSDSREDLRDLASALGLQDVDQLCQDRFRVDRRKLEHMLLGELFSERIVYFVASSSIYVYEVNKAIILTDS